MMDRVAAGKATACMAGLALAVVLCVINPEIFVGLLFACLAGFLVWGLWMGLYTGFKDNWRF